jgi:hypothetical protein
LRAVRFAILLVLLVSIAAVGSGCPALMIPGLAYSGYQYVEEKNSGTAANQEATKPATKADSSKRSDDNFE